MTWRVLERCFKMLLLVTSPPFRKDLENALKKLYLKAQNTLNPWDDYFVMFLMRLLVIELTDDIIEKPSEYKED